MAKLRIRNPLRAVLFSTILLLFVFAILFPVFAKAKMGGKPGKFASARLQRNWQVFQRKESDLTFAISSKDVDGAIHAWESYSAEPIDDDGRVWPVRQWTPLDRKAYANFLLGDGCIGKARPIFASLVTGDFPLDRIYRQDTKRDPENFLGWMKVSADATKEEKQRVLDAWNQNSDQISGLYGEARAEYLVGKSLESAGKSNDAVAHYRRACELEPSSLPAKEALAQAREHVH